MGRFSKANALKPFTPVRRLFLKLDSFKSSVVLGKRARDDLTCQESMDPVIDTPAQLSVNPHIHTRRGAHKPACMALQNDDSTGDIVIITALDTIPFCCHEDLMTMSREQLVAAACSLNTKLPAALRLDVSDTRSDIFIRNSIEVVVGIRKNVPPAPKAIRSRSEESPRLLGNFNMQINTNRSPSSSPLAMRSRSCDLHTSLGSPKLPKLVEEDEDDAMVVDRPAKKRRVTARGGLRTSRARSSDVDPLCFTPTPLPELSRSQSNGVAPTTSLIPRRVLRSHSQKLPDEMENIKFDATFITTTRPRYRCKPKDENARKVLRARPSQNPKRISRSGHDFSGYKPFFIEDAFSDDSINQSKHSLSPCQNTHGKKRKRNIGNHYEPSMDVDVTCGMSEMNIGGHTDVNMG